MFADGRKTIIKTETAEDTTKSIDLTLESIQSDDRRESRLLAEVGSARQNYNQTFFELKTLKDEMKKVRTENEKLKTKLEENRSKNMVAEHSHNVG